MATSPTENEEMKQPKFWQQVYRKAPPILIAPDTVSDILHPDNNHKNSQNCTFLSLNALDLDKYHCNEPICIIIH